VAHMSADVLRAVGWLALIGLWMALAGTPALAQPVGRAGLLGDVEWVIGALAKDSSDAFVIEATDLIEESQDGNPGVMLRNASIAFRDWGRVELGTIRAVERLGTAGLKQIVFLLPNVIDLYNLEGQALPPPIQLGAASLTAEFAPERDVLRHVALVLRNAGFTEAAGTFALDKLSIVSTAVPKVGGLLVSTLAIDIDGLSMQGTGQDRFKVGKLAVRQDAEDVRTSAVEAFVSSLRDFPKSVDSAFGGEETLRNLVAALKRHGVLMSAIRLSARLGGLEFVDKARDQNLRLAGFVIEQELRGFDRGTVDWRFAAEYAGLETPQTTMDPRLFLTGLAVDLAISGIPAGRILEAVDASYARTPIGQADSALPKLMQEIGTASGLSVQVNRLAFATPRLAGQARGRFQLDPGAAQFGEGEAFITLHGLDRLIEGMRTGQDAYDPGTTGFLMMLGALAVPARAPDGRPAQSMRVQFGRDGKLMVNGRDLTRPPQQQVP
jgi:hypothetical protein